MKLILTILLISLFLVESIHINGKMLRRKREFKQSRIQPSDAVLGSSGAFKDLKVVVDKVANAVTEVWLIDVTKNEETFIIGDAGGSGTRLYIGYKDGTKVLQIKSDNKMDTNPTEAGAFVSEVRTIMGNPATIVGATAGMRVAGTSLSTVQTTVCGTDVKCKIMVLPGTIEGILGWADGTSPVDPGYTSKPTAGDCYLEIGSTSSQVAIPIGSGNVWVMSGVQLAFKVNALVKAASKNTCDSKGSTFSMTTCKSDVEGLSALWDSGYTNCITGKPSGLTCTRLLIRQPPMPVIDTMKDPTSTNCKETGTASRNSEWRCALSFALNKWLNTGLGLNLGAATVIEVPKDKANYGVEWAWGLYNVMNPLKFAMTGVTFTEHAVAKSDCGTVKPSAGLAITNWIHA